MTARSGLALRLFLLAGAALASSACAQGSTIDAFRTSGSGDGGSGDGGAPSEGGSDGDGGSKGSSTGSTGSTSVSGSSTSVGSTSSSVASSTSSSSTTASSTSAATTSSSTGGPSECDSVDPAPVCGGGQHCMPAPQGEEASCLPAGNGPPYSGCNNHNECSAPTACINVDGFFPCCLQFCHGPDDCSGGADDCYSFADFGGPFYSDGVEVGFCYDGAGGCL